MAQFEHFVRTELSQPLKVKDIGLLLFTGDNDSHKVGADVSLRNVPQTLTGSIIGYIIRPDSQTVVVTGAKAGNRGYIELPESAFVAQGRVDIVVRNVDSGKKTVICAVSGVVRRTTTDEIIDPGHVIPSLDELLAKLDEMDELIDEAQGVVDSSVRYDITQRLTDAQKLQARNNIGVGTGLVSYAEVQSLTGAQKAQARQNIQAAQVSPTDFNGNASGFYIEY